MAHIVKFLLALTLKHSRLDVQISVSVVNEWRTGTCAYIKWIWSCDWSNSRSNFREYQQEDGSVIIPEVLVPYMGGEEVIK